MATTPPRPTFSLFTRFLPLGPALVAKTSLLKIFFAMWAAGRGPRRTYSSRPGPRKGGHHKWPGTPPKMHFLPKGCYW